MEFKKVSIILHTINRYHITKEYIGKALRTAGYPFELCLTDNGSNEIEIFEWIEQQKPKQYIRNGYNAGTAQSINKMIQLNPSDYYCFIGNDIDLPDNWLRAMVEHAEAIPNSGMVGINWRPVEYATETINGKAICKTDRVFGDVLFSQQVIDKLGGACEDYGVYGLWDSDFAIRCKIAGFINYYIAGMRSEHMANDVGEQIGRAHV